MDLITEDKNKETVEGEEIAGEVENGKSMKQFVKRLKLVFQSRTDR